MPEDDAPALNDHSFSKSLAAELGIKEAIVFQYIAYRVRHSKKVIGSKHWYFDTTDVLASKFPYLSRSSVDAAVKNLRAEGYIEIDCKNRKGFDQTRWFTLTEKGRKGIVSDPIYFNVDDAKEHGLLAAVILKHIAYSVTVARRKDSGALYVHISGDALTHHFPFAPKSTINRKLAELCSGTGAVLKRRAVLKDQQQFEYAFTDDSRLRRSYTPPPDESDVALRTGSIPVSNTALNIQATGSNPVNAPVGVRLSTGSNPQTTGSKEEITGSDPQRTGSNQDDNTHYNPLEQTVTTTSYSQPSAPPPVAGGGGDVIQVQLQEIIKKARALNDGAWKDLGERKQKELSLLMIGVGSACLRSFSDEQLRFLGNQTPNEIHRLLSESLATSTKESIEPLRRFIALSMTLGFFRMENLFVYPFLPGGYQIHCAVYSRVYELRMADFKKQRAEQCDRMQRALDSEHRSPTEDREGDASLSAKEKTIVFINRLKALNAAGIINEDLSRSEVQFKFSHHNKKALERFFTVNEHVCVSDFVPLLQNIQRADGEEESADGREPHFFMRRAINLSFFLTHLEKVVAESELDLPDFLFLTKEQLFGGAPLDDITW